MAEDNKTARQLFWEHHKNDIEYVERHNQQRRDSYYKHADKERAKALERYYKRKEKFEKENPDAPKKKVGRPRKVQDAIINEQL